MAEMERKVMAALADGKGKVPKKDKFEKPLFERDVKRNGMSATTMTGFAKNSKTARA